MELSKEQKDELVFEITEKILLRMPEVIGNLIQEHTSMKKLTDDYLEKNPTFKEQPLIVQKVLEQLEANNTALPYDKLLILATPKIEQQIKLSSSCNITSVKQKHELNTTINGSL